MNNPQFPLFLSTAIPYVNAAPHVGHALELLQADALCRHQRQRGRDVRLTGGTDDLSLKNARAAERLGVPTEQLVAQHGETFRRLQGALGVELDDYVHTSRDPRHAPAVQALWQRCAANGDLYVAIRVREHAFFQRDGNHLVCQVPITFSQAALGGEIQVPTLDGAKSHRIRAGVQSGEVVRIVEYLRQTLSPERFAAVVQSVRTIAEQDLRLSPAERGTSVRPCPLLANRRCLAYPVRPLTCRGFNSEDAELCEGFLHDRKIRVPVYEPQMRLASFVLDGMRAGLAEAGLKSDRVELTAALRIVLDLPDAVERWLSGEGVFTSARLD